MTDESQLPEAELAALADGALSAERSAELRARIDASPELTRALAEQERAVTMLRALDEPAPDPLRARVRELTDGRASRTERRRGPSWRRSLFVPAATALAVAVAAVLVLFGGGSSPPTVPQTAHLALAAATAPAPGEDATHRDQLNLRFAGLAFPYYGRTAGWKATGSRRDSLGGRRVVTVFYSAHGTRVGYAIVSGAPLSVSGATVVDRGGVRYWLRRTGDAQLVTWRQAGHTCVIAGRGVSAGTLLELAVAEEIQAGA